MIYKNYLGIFMTQLFLTKLFRMPKSLEHFKGKDNSYISLFSKSLSTACKQKKNSDYSDIFHKWTDYFLPEDKEKIESRIKDWMYIKRKLSSLIKEKNLENERLNGEVGYYKNHYIGAESLRLRAQQIENNERFLRKHFHVSTNKLESSIHSSQARKYFAENYNACIGTEEYARDLDYGCLFITLTVPGHMHANPGNKNNTWDGTTIKEAHDYLAQKWKKFTNDLSRKKYNIKMSKGDLFGYRAVEPHADGTPHWHVLIYSARKLLKGPILTLLKKHFSDKSEALTTSFFPMNSEDESSPPISYIVKYLSGAVYFDNNHIANNNDEQIKAQQIDAWKSAVRLRSFQRFGRTAPMTYWRLFRKFHTQWNSGELQLVFERNRKQGQKNYLNRVFSKAYRVMLSTRTSDTTDEKEIRRHFTNFIYAIKKLEISGHNVLIKEVFDNKYGEEKYRIAGLDFGNAKYIFKEFSDES
jgi:hypothetical protein